MKTNYQMLLSLFEEEFKPERTGFLNEDEVSHLEKVFCISDRADVELQNFRDFVVLFFSTQVKEKPEAMDLMSGICGIIDSEKSKRGLVV